ELLLLPPVLLLRLLLPDLERSGSGRLIAITSIAVREPNENLVLSNIVRPGVTGWAKTLSRELGPKGITANCVAPGRIDPARVAPLVGVQGGHEPKGPGGICFVDVLERRASILDELFPRVLHGEGASLVPATQVVPPGTNDRTARRIDLRMMQMSQKIAAAVALRTLGYKVMVRPIGVLVDSVLEGSGAVGQLEPTDVIVSLDGHAVRTFADLHRELGRHRISEVVTVGVRSGDRLTAVHVKLTRLRPHSNFPAIGIFPEQ